MEWGVLLVTGGASHQENYGPGFAAEEFFTALRGPERIASASARCSGLRSSGGICLNRRGAAVVIDHSLVVEMARWKRERNRIRVRSQGRSKATFEPPRRRDRRENPGHQLNRRGAERGKSKIEPPSSPRKTNSIHDSRKLMNRGDAEGSKIEFGNEKNQELSPRVTWPDLPRVPDA